MHLVRVLVQNQNQPSAQTRIARTGQKKVTRNFLAPSAGGVEPPIPAHG
jgi:hypothetical protein